jgi:hypothetical protein
MEIFSVDRLHRVPAFWIHGIKVSTPPKGQYLSIVTPREPERIWMVRKIVRPRKSAWER